MRGTIKHIGIVVDKLNETISCLKELTGIESVPVHQYMRDGLHYNIAVIEFGGIELELIEPQTKKGMAQDHLDRFGQGVYHFAFEVDDLDESISTVHKRGFMTNSERKGIHGGRVCFLRKEVIPGISLELTERTDK